MPLSPQQIQEKNEPGKSLHPRLLKTYNEIVTSTNSLADTGANDVNFINTRYAIKLARLFNRKFQELPFKCFMKGYNGAPGGVIDHTLALDLWVDRWRFQDVPLLITDLGQHHVILGKEWLAAQDIWLDVKN
ncbi:hypothetical protein PABG_12674 [Paracoccidioides brasiliensis Pb03]|nr:hypothetical protein PABG_12674 [Paracoccidioides brasiliensis Pb03]